MAENLKSSKFQSSSCGLLVEELLLKERRLILSKGNAIKLLSTLFFLITSYYKILLYTLMLTSYLSSSLVAILVAIRIVIKVAKQYRLV